MVMNKRSDSLSRETEFSGLPKSMKLFATVPQGPFGAPAWGQLSFNTIMFNYGGFTPVLGGLGYTAIVVPESGIYMLHASNEWATGGAESGLLIFCLNGAAGGTAIPGTGHGSVSTNVAGPRTTISDVAELHTGDAVAAQAYSTAGAQFGGVCTMLAVTKLPGQY
jgi:hypothetical protein